MPLSGSRLACCLVLILAVGSSSSVLASRSEQDVGLADMHLRGARGPASAVVQHRPTTTTTTTTLHHRLAPLRDDEPTNIEYAVDYSDEDAADELQAMQEQQMTFSTHFPVPAGVSDLVEEVLVPQHHHVRPVHHQLHAADAERDASLSLAEAVNHAWTRARVIASRLADAADAAAAAQLVAELEATVDNMVAAQDAAAVAAAAAANDVIDHRWDTFEPQQQEADQQQQHMPEALLVHDIGSMRPRSSDAAAEADAKMWSEAFADYIDPIRQYVSGMDDYDQAEWLSQQQQQQEDAEFTAASSSSTMYNLSPNSRYNARINHLDSMAVEYGYDDYSISSRGGSGVVVGMLPADPTLAAAAAAAAPYPAEPDEDDIGMFISPDDHAANSNMLLLGGSAAAGAATKRGADSSSSVAAWSAAMLEWMSAAPFEQLDAVKAAAVLLVGCTLMVLVAFVVSVVDLRATVHSAATTTTPTPAAVVGGTNSSGNSRGAGSSNSSYNVVAPLRTRKSAFGGGSSSSSSASAAAAAVVAAAAASMGGCCAAATSSSGRCCDVDVDDLSMPLLLDADEDDCCVADTAADVEAPRAAAAAAAVGPSASLPRVLQKFYNPLHYQVLPSGDQE